MILSLQKSNKTWREALQFRTKKNKIAPFKDGRDAYITKWKTFNSCTLQIKILMKIQKLESRHQLI